MPLRADILAMGALIAWLQFSDSISTTVRRVFKIVFWSTAAFFPIFAWVIENSNFSNAMWGHTYLVAFYGSAVFMVLDRRDKPWLGFLRSGLAAFFARISYALYLTHTSVLILVFSAVKYHEASMLTWRGTALLICAF